MAKKVGWEEFAKATQDYEYKLRKFNERIQDNTLSKVDVTTLKEYKEMDDAAKKQHSLWIAYIENIKW